MAKFHRMYAKSEEFMEMLRKFKVCEKLCTLTLERCKTMLIDVDCVHLENAANSDEPLAAKISVDTAENGISNVWIRKQPPNHPSTPSLTPPLGQINSYGLRLHDEARVVRVKSFET